MHVSVLAKKGEHQAWDQRLVGTGQLATLSSHSGASSLPGQPQAGPF